MIIFDGARVGGGGVGGRAYKTGGERESLKILTKAPSDDL